MKSCHELGKVAVYVVLASLLLEILPSFAQSQMISKAAQLFAADGAATDNFGVSVSLSADGHTALVGASSDDTAAGDAAGSAYVFVRYGTNWVQQIKLAPSEVGYYQLFGKAVCLTGDGGRALVASGGNTASVYVFARNGTNWSQESKLTSGVAGDDFGGSISTSSDGSTAIVGSRLGERIGGFAVGCAYVFVRDGTNWSQQAKLKAGDGVPGDRFGNAVSLTSDGNMALMGTYLDDTIEGNDAGSAYVFSRDGTNWTEQTKLLAGDGGVSDGYSGDWFGYSVDLNGDGSVAVVGACFDDTTAGNNAGSAYVFERSGTNWVKRAKLVASDGAVNDNFGYALSLSSDGNTTLVGAYLATFSNEAGKAYIYERNGNSWMQKSGLTPGDSVAYAHFGFSVSLCGSGDTVLVGAPSYNTAAGQDAGAAYVFQRVVPIIILSEPTRLGGSLFQFSITSSTGALLQVWRSTNALSWSSVSLLTNSAGTTSFIDSNAISDRGFYRVQYQP